MSRSLLLSTGLLVLAAHPGWAQDVEMLGERYGTPVPEAYERARRGDPSAFEFRRGWAGRGEGQAFFDGRSGAGPQLNLGPRSGPVTGTFELPVLLGMFENSGGVPPFIRATVDDAYFGTGPGTIAAYYDEVSNGLVSLLGDVRPWVVAPRADTSYAVDESGLVAGPLGGGGAGNFVWDLIEAQPATDWGRYDNDGPDGDPNSGDDDGFVDVLTVVHADRGGECGGGGGSDRIWSHRWTLSSAITDAGPYVTDSPAAGGGFVKIDDYTIQAAVACNGGALNQIGVFTHELGHAFGLPDLYDTDTRNGRTSGAGIWDLMSSGSWGCDNDTPERPCHMGAWSKAALGWVDVVTLAPDTDHGTLTIPPVETSATVYRVDAADGSGEYFLLENRQRVGFDENLFEEGLLVWHIDPDWVLSRWPINQVNAGEHLGVRLRQADGRDDLGEGFGRGDAGDPFPGGQGNVVFHAGSTPAATSFEGGTPTGLTVVDIERLGDDVRLGLLTRFTALTVRAEGSAGSDGIFTVDGAAVDPPATTFSSAPFATHEIEAVAGEVVAPGERRPFTGWQDDPGAPRTRTVLTPLADTEFVAGYGGTQYELALSTTGGVNGVEPGSFPTDPLSADLWFDADAAVTLEAVPQVGFSFLGWSGGLAGQANPASFTMSAPVSAGADFELIYDVSETTVRLPAATDLDVQFEVENGTDPVRWSVVGGTLPLGLKLSSSGRLTGAAFDMGTTDVTVRAIDGIGLPATGVVTLDLLAPDIPIERLTAHFLLTPGTLSAAEVTFLDRHGNGVAPYDIGDLRAWLLANPELPFSADIDDGTYRRVIIRRPPSARQDDP